MSEAQVVDRDSRRQIREDLFTSILVEAGAGSGKTQMLAERMAAGVAAGAYQVEHMAAVTFTRKAASELRGRFHLALEARLRFLHGLRTTDHGPRTRLLQGLGGSATDNGLRTREVERLNSALGNLERFFAGTIHSFCARLLRERPVESGVSPGFTELDEVQDLKLRKRVWRDFISSARAAGDPDMVALLETGVRPRDLDSGFAIVCTHEDVEFPPGTAPCPDPKGVWPAVEQFWKELQKHLPAAIDPQTTCPIQKAALEFRAQLRISRRRLDRPAVVASLLEAWDCENRITQKCWSDNPAEKKRLRDLIPPLQQRFLTDTVNPWLSQWRQYIYRLAVSLLTRAREHAAAERRRLNTLNYGDLLNLTARVLRENAHVRHGLQRKYRFLFVDEFQDTDPVQAEIAFLLAADEAGHGNFRAVDGAANSAPEAASGRNRTPDPGPRIPDIAWRSVRLRPGALFVVGDPKQSIYRFRRADIEIYNIVRRRFSELSVNGASNSASDAASSQDRTPDPGSRTPARILSLTTNFRSTPELCEWANGVFRTRFPDTPTQHTPAFAALDPKPETDHGPSDMAAARPAGSRKLEAGSRKPEAGSPGVFTLTHSCESSEVLEQDADKIARYIRSEVDAGRRRFSDFLILTRKKAKRITPYAAALEALNVPIEVSGAGAFGQSPEVEVLRMLLCCLSDPQDSLALVAVLRGPLFGVSDSELFAYRQAGGWFSIFAGLRHQDQPGGGQREGDEAPVSVTVVPSIKNRTPDPGPRTTDYDEDARVAAPAVGYAFTALSTYYRWTRLLPAPAALDRILEHTGYLALASTTPGGVEAGDLLHALDRVRQVVEDGGSLSDAADALAEDAEETTEVESLPLEPGRTDVVRVMNLHKAKGLEADVVFLADPTGGFNPRVDVHVARTGDRAQGWFRLERKFENSYGAQLLGEHGDWAQHEETERPYLVHEHDRLLYVAATRAREQLVVSRFTGNNSRPAWGALEPFLTAARDLRVPVSVNVQPNAVSDSSAAAQAEANTARIAAHDRVRQASWSITSVTAEARYIARMTRAADPAPDDPTRVVRTDTATHRADAGLAWGTLIHGLLEHAMRHKDATREDLRRLAMWLTVEEPQLRAVIEEALDTVEAVKDAEFWKAARQASHSVEAPFTVREGGPVLSIGVIDLLHDSADGWTVVDYKTDASLSGPAEGAYVAQLSRYRKALERCGLTVSSAVLQPVRTPEPRRTCHDARVWY